MDGRLAADARREGARLPCRTWTSRPTRAQHGTCRAPARCRRTAELEPLVTRVLAPNPSGMTLDGTNTYVVGDAGQRAGGAGRPRARTTPRTWPRSRRRSPPADARCVAVLVTHHHGDHAEAALPWGRAVRRAGRGRRRRRRRPARAGARAGGAAGAGRHHDRRRPDARAHRRPPGLPAGVRGGAGRRPRARARARRWSPIPRATSSPTWSPCAGCTTSARARSTAGTAPS